MANRPRPATLDHLRSKKALRVDHSVTLDNQLSRALNEARTALEEAEKGGDAVVIQAAGEAYNRAREAAAESTVVFRLKAVPGHVLDKMSRQNRVTDADRERLKEEGMTDEEINRVPHSPSTWPAVVIAATVDEPKMTPEQVTELIWENDEWNRLERELLLRAVGDVNNGIATVDLGAPFGERPAHKVSKRSPTASGAPAASS